MSGAFKNMDVRLRRNMVIELAKLRIPSNPRTPQQQAIRKRYGELVGKWRSLSPEEKEYYNQQAKQLKISGWNYFLMVQWGIIMGFKKLKDITLETTQTEIVLDGLDINKHGFYQIIAMIKNAGGGGQRILCCPEDHLDDSEYYTETAWWGGSSYNYSRDNNNQTLYLEPLRPTMAVILIMLDPDGYPHIVSYTGRDRASNTQLQIFHVTGCFTLSNITKITFKSETTDGMAAGSRIMVFGYEE